MARSLTSKTRDTILEAAAAVFARRGFHDVLTDEIAGEAGVGKGTLYRYFRTKDEMFHSALLLGFDELEAALAAGGAPDEAPPDVLRRAAADVLRIFWDRPTFYLNVTRDASAFRSREREFLRRRARLARFVREAIARGIGSGDFRRVPPRVAAEMFLGMLRGALRYRSAEDTPESLVDTLCLVFLGGISRRREAR